DDLERLRRLNFGIRTLKKPLSAATLSAELARYDAADARLVSDRLRERASSADLHAALLSIYEEVIAEHVRADGQPAWPAESRAVADFLHELAVRERHREASQWALAKASQRMLRLPVLGPLGT